MPDALKSPSSLDASSSLTLGDLLGVIIDLLPNELDLCINLLRKLQVSGRVASKPLDEEASEVHMAFTSMVSEGKDLCSAVLARQKLRRRTPQAADTLISLATIPDQYEQAVPIPRKVVWADTTDIDEHGETPNCETPC